MRKEILYGPEAKDAFFPFFFVCFLFCLFACLLACFCFEGVCYCFVLFLKGKKPTLLAGGVAAAAKFSISPTSWP